MPDGQSPDGILLQDLVSGQEDVDPWFDPGDFFNPVHRQYLVFRQGCRCRKAVPLGTFVQGRLHLVRHSSRIRDSVL